jgi:hypothetical protein
VVEIIFTTLLCPMGVLLMVRKSAMGNKSSLAIASKELLIGRITDNVLVKRSLSIAF